MTEPVLFGAAYSVYTRVARLALHEKQVPHGFETVDVFADGGPPEWYRRLHPFGRIPALRHGEATLYETAAITRYIDEAFAGPALQPEGALGRARVAQLIGALDSYGYRAMVWDIFVERVRQPQRGAVADEARIAAALPVADRCLGVLEEALGGGEWFVQGCPGPTLADLHAAPMLSYLRAAPEGAGLLSRWPRVSGWLARIAARVSMQATPSPLLGAEG